MNLRQAEDELTDFRNVLQQTLQFVTDEINNESQGEPSSLKSDRKWKGNKLRQDRNKYLLLGVALKRPTEHFSALRMTRSSFNWLLDNVEPYLQRTDAVMRITLPAALKLEIVLNLLSTGSSIGALALRFGISMTSIISMIPNVCHAIYRALQEYIQVPNDWKKIEAGFRNTWNFPRCCGAVGSKHIVLKTDAENMSQYKVTFLALCDDDYCFRYIDVGSEPNVTGGNGFQESDLNVALENNRLPPDHVIVGNCEFPLKKFLMKPYEGNNLSDKEKVFNLRLARASRVIDNAFGMIVSRFRIFEKPVPFSPAKVEKMLTACCALHNWFRQTNYPIEVTTLDVEDIATGNVTPGSWRELKRDGMVDLPVNLRDISYNNARLIRDKYAEDFMKEGAVNGPFHKIT